jgi:hypothetical protein
MLLLGESRDVLMLVSLLLVSRIAGLRLPMSH